MQFKKFLIKLFNFFLLSFLWKKKKQSYKFYLLAAILFQTPAIVYHGRLLIVKFLLTETNLNLCSLISITVHIGFVAGANFFPPILFIID